MEQFHENTLTGSCVDMPFTGHATYSAPELTLAFDLSDPMTNDGITSGSREGSLSLYCWYGLVPSVTSLKPEPHVP